MHKITAALIVAVVTVLLSGCGKSDQAAVATKKLPTADGTLTKVATATASAVPAPVAKVAAEVTAASEFVPPFPQNIDIFAPPKAPPPPPQPSVVKPESPKAPAVATASPPPAPVRRERPAVELVGFVNVAAPKAILSVSGEVRALQTGDSLHELEVLEIEPPNVVLQFDDEQFTVNLLERNTETDPPDTLGTRGPRLPNGFARAAASRANAARGTPPAPNATSMPVAPPLPQPLPAEAAAVQPPAPPPAMASPAKDQLPPLPPLPNVKPAPSPAPPAQSAE